MEEAEAITQERLALWNKYHDALSSFEALGKLRRPIVPQDFQHNAHMYYILLNSLEERKQLISEFKKHDVNAVFHYVPLHSSPSGTEYGRVHGDMTNTDQLSDRLLRLPLWVGLQTQQLEVLNALKF